MTLLMPLKGLMLRCASLSWVASSMGSEKADLGVAAGNGKGKIFKHGEVIRTVPEGEIVQFLVQEANRMADEMDTTGAVEVTVS